MVLNHKSGQQQKNIWRAVPTSTFPRWDERLSLVPGYMPGTSYSSIKLLISQKEGLVVVQGVPGSENSCSRFFGKMGLGIHTENFGKVVWDRRSHAISKHNRHVCSKNVTISHGKTDKPNLKEPGASTLIRISQAWGKHSRKASKSKPGSVNCGNVKSSNRHRSYFLAACWDWLEP